MRGITRRSRSEWSKDVGQGCLTHRQLRADKKRVGANRGEVRSHEERGWWGGPPRGSCYLICWLNRILPRPPHAHLALVNTLQILPSSPGRSARPTAHLTGMGREIFPWPTRLHITFYAVFALQTN